ncbi:hypothetical protein TNCV_3461621 [Trichonephila clavipes]|nr:hypothetical protein TNCV_3461621 [Trichonephila clavipes]
MVPIKLSNTEMKFRHGVTPILAKLAIPFLPNWDPQDTPQQTGQRGRIGGEIALIIEQNKFITDSNGISVDIHIDQGSRPNISLKVPPWNTYRLTWPLR